MSTCILIVKVICCWNYSVFVLVWATSRQRLFIVLYRDLHWFYCDGVLIPILYLCHTWCIFRFLGVSTVLHVWIYDKYNIIQQTLNPHCEFFFAHHTVLLCEAAEAIDSGSGENVQSVAQSAALMSLLRVRVNGSNWSSPWPTWMATQARRVDVGGPVVHPQYGRFSVLWSATAVACLAASLQWTWRCRHPQCSPPIHCVWPMTLGPGRANAACHVRT